ncbi:MAG: hypothetical protein R3C39_04345 [Dehalococcoidia bacterium]
MTMTLAPRRFAILLAAVAISIVAFACSSSDDETATPTTEPTASATASETASATATTTESASPTATAGTGDGEPLQVVETTVAPGLDATFEEWVTADGPANDTIPDQWDERAVVEGYLDYFLVPCAGVESVAVTDGQASFPADEGTRACFDDAVAGESPEAIAFLHQYGQFLASFEEQGTVDVGSIGAAWVNMGRGEPVILNGEVPMLPVTWLLFGGDASPVDGWLAEPAYAEAIAGHDPIAWAEYTTITPAAAPMEGGQAFHLSIPVQDCRACEVLATIEVEYRFDDAGALYEYALLPPGPGTSS